MRRALGLAALVGALTVPAGADARPDPRRAVLTPVSLEGRSAFETLRDLGAGTFAFTLDWARVAPDPVGTPRDPGDRAYDWPDELDFALAQAARDGSRVVVTLRSTPFWANGARPPAVLPLDATDLADFAVAASRRYPRVGTWRVLDRTNDRASVLPLSGPPTRGGPLSATQRRQVGRIAVLQDRVARALRAADPRDLVVGGNVTADGDVAPREFLDALRLPDRTPPRMDLLGFDPISPRRPGAADPPLGDETADLGTLDRVAAWSARLARRGRRAPRLHLARYVTPPLPADEQAGWVRDAYAIALADPRVDVLTWGALRDGPQDGDGLTTAVGLRKPAYEAFRGG